MEVKNSIQILEDFKNTGDSRCVLAYRTIISQKPYEYEEEYGTDFVHFTDEILANMFIYKMGMYKYSSMNTIFDKYKRFYQYCVDQGYLIANPFVKSKNLNVMRLSAMAVENGNVPLYSRSYITESCRQNEAGFYYKSILLSLYEGIPSLTYLIGMKYDDVDFNAGTTSVNGAVLQLSDELLEAYRELRQAPAMSSGRKRIFFDNQENYLIKRVVPNGKSRSVPTVNSLRSNLSLKISKYFDISLTGVYDSGVVNFLAAQMGEDRLFELINSRCGKSDKIRFYDELEEVLRQYGIVMEGKYALYNYVAYILALKFNKIR